MQLALNQIIVLPGSKILLKDISWQMFEILLNELGEGRATRISYSKGQLEVMAPLPEHEVGKKIIGNLVEILMEELNIDFWSLGSTTFKNENMLEAVEADDCFYIKNEAAVRGKKRIDLTVDPPPDLAIEIDITSRTRFNNYEALGVPELWRYDGRRLQINILEAGTYLESNYSHNFPGMPLTEIIPEYIDQSKTVGRNATMKAFRKWVREQIQ